MDNTNPVNPNVPVDSINNPYTPTELTPLAQQLAVINHAGSSDKNIPEQVKTIEQLKTLTKQTNNPLIQQTASKRLTEILSKVNTNNNSNIQTTQNNPSPVIQNKITTVNNAMQSKAARLGLTKQATVPEAPIVSPSTQNTPSLTQPTVPKLPDANATLPASSSPNIFTNSVNKFLAGDPTQPVNNSIVNISPTTFKPKQDKQVSLLSTLPDNIPNTLPASPNKSDRLTNKLLGTKTNSKAEQLKNKLLATKEPKINKPLQFQHGSKKDSAGNPIDITRPIIHNKDGSFSTERTITVFGSEIGLTGADANKGFNLPTMFNGKMHSPKEAIAGYKAGKNSLVGKFATVALADKAAIQRSKDIGKLRDPQNSISVVPKLNTPEQHKEFIINKAKADVPKDVKVVSAYDKANPRKINLDTTFAESVDKLVIGLNKDKRILAFAKGFGKTHKISLARSGGTIIADSAKSMLNGVIDIADIAVEVPNIALLGIPDRAFKAVTGKSYSQVTQNLKDYIDSTKSISLRNDESNMAYAAELRRVRNDAKYSNELIKFGANFIDAAGESINHPASTFDSFFRSLPQLLVPGILATKAESIAGKSILNRIVESSLARNGGKFAAINAKESALKFLATDVGKAYLKRLRVKTGLGYIAASEGISNGITVQAQVFNSSDADLKTSSPFYVLLRSGGKSEAQAKRLLADKAAAITTGLAGAFGLAASIVTGAGEFETNFFKLKSKVGKNIISKIAAIKLLRGAITEGTEETLQGFTGQIASNIGTFFTTNLHQKLLQGVATSGAQGGLIGLLSGGLVAAPAGALNVTKTVVTKTAEAINNQMSSKDVKDINKAVKAGDISTIVDTANPAYHPSKAFVATIALYNAEQATAKAEHTDGSPIETVGKNGLTPSQSKLLPELRKHLDNFIAEVKAKSVELDNKGNKVTLKETQGLQKSLELALKYKNMLKGVTENSGLTTEELNKKINNVLDNSSKNAEADIAVIKGSMRLGKDINIQDAQKLANSDKISKSDKVDINNYIITKQQQAKFAAARDNLTPEEKTAENTSKGILGGDILNTSIFEHQARVATAADIPTATKLLVKFANFVYKRVVKANEMQAAFNTVKKSGGVVHLPGFTVHKGTPKSQLDLRIHEAAVATATLKQTIRDFYKTTQPDLTEKQLAHLTNNPFLTGSISDPANKSNIDKFITANKIKKNVSKSSNKITAILQKQLDKISADAGVVPVKGTMTSASDPSTQQNTEALPTGSKDSTPTEVTGNPAKQADNVAVDVKPLSPSDNVPIKTMITHLENVKTIKTNPAYSVIKQVINKFNNNETLSALEKTIITAAYNTDINNTTVSKVKVNKVIFNDTITSKEIKPGNVQKIINLSDVFVAKDSNSVLVTTVDFMQNIKNPDSEAHKILLSKLSEDTETAKKQIAAINKFNNFRNIFKKHLLAYFDQPLSQTGKDFAYQDLARLFFKEGNTQITDNMITAWALSGFTWLTGRGLGSLANNDTTIMSLLNLQGDEDIPPIAYSLFKNAGILQKLVSADLGRDAIKHSGLAIKNNDLQDNIIAKLNFAVGHVILAAMLNADFIQQTTVRADDINKLIKESKTLTETTNKPATKTNTISSKVVFTFIRLKSAVNSNDEFSINTPAINIETYIDNANEINNVLTNAFSTVKTSNTPLLKSSTKIRAAKNFLIELDKFALVKETIHRLQSIPHTFNNGTWSVVRKLSSNAQMLLIGATPYINKTIQINLRDSERSKNNKKARDLADIHQFYNSLLNKDAEFFYMYNYGSTGRTNMLSHGTSIQGNKTARGFIGVATHNVTIKLNNIKDIRVFFTALLDAAGEKPPVYFKDLQPTVEAFFSTPVMQKGLKALAEIQKGEEGKIPSNIQQDLLNAIKHMNVDTSGLEALVAWQNYKHAIDNNETEFKTNLAHEEDGQNNGTAINVLQTPGDLTDKAQKDILNRTGTFFTASYKTSKQYLNTINNNDVYQNLVLHWVKAKNNFSSLFKNKTTLLKAYRSGDKNAVHNITIFLKSVKNVSKSKDLNSEKNLAFAQKVFLAMDSLVGDMLDANNKSKVTSLGRELGKGPQIKFGFGAGEATNTLHFINNLEVKIYTDIQEAHKTKDLRKLQEISANLNSVGISANLNLTNALTFSLPELNSPQRNAFRNKVRIVYGLSMQKALETTAGSMRNFRNELIKQLNNTSEIFLAIFKRAEKAKIKQIAKANNLNIKDVRLTRKEFEDLSKSLKDLMPQIISAQGVPIYGVKLTPEFVSVNTPEGAIFKETTHMGKGIKIKNTTSNNGKPAGSLSSTGSKFTWQPAILSAMASSTLSIDAAIMAKALKNIDGVNLFDAGRVSIKDSKAFSDEINKAYLEVNDTYSVVGAIYNHMLTMHAALIKYAKSSKTDYSANIKLLEDAINKFKPIVEKTNARRHKIIKEINHTNQYRSNIDSYKPNTAQESTKASEVAPTTNKTETATAVPLSESLNNVTEHTVVDPVISNELNNINLDTQIANFVEEVIPAIKNNEVNLTAKQTIFYEANQEAIDKALNVINVINAVNIKGSQATLNINPEVFDNVAAKEVNANNVVNTLDMLGKTENSSVPISTSHLLTLRNLLTDLSIGIIEPLKLKIIRLFNVENNAGFAKGKEIFVINGANAIASRLLMSTQEIYAHEVLHTIIAAGIDGDSLAKQELVKLFNLANANTTVEDFLDDPADINNPVEMQIATDRYNYIFRNTDKIEQTYTDPHTKETVTLSRNNYLHEFMTFGLTNERFIKHLQTIISKVEASEPFKGGLYNRLVNLLNRIKIFFSRKFINTDNQNINASLKIIAQKFANTEAKNKGIISESTGILGYLDSNVGDLINKVIIKPVIKLISNPVLQNTKSKLLSSASKLAGRIPNIKFDAFYEQVLKLRNSLVKTEGDFATALFTEFVGRTPRSARLHALLSLSNKNLDQERKAVSNRIIEQIHDELLPSSLGTKAKTAITRALIRTGLSSLVDTYTQNEFLKLTGDSKFLNTEIDRLETSLRKLYPEQGTYYVNASENLAHFITFGEAKYDANMAFNAYAIARLFGTNKVFNNTKETGIDLDKAEKLINQLVSLKALRKNSGEKLTLNKVMQTEYARGTDNGISFLMRLINKHNKEALDLLFDNQKALIMHGYSKDMYNSNISYRVSADPNNTELIRDGFKRVSALKIDKADTVTKAGTLNNTTYLYVSDFAPMRTRMSGIVSTANDTAAGTLFGTVAEHRGYDSPDITSYFNVFIMRKQKINVSDKMFGTNPVVNNPTKNKVAIPLYNNKGNIVDYRYIMNTVAKDSLLQRNNAFDDILGNMFANIINKVNSKEINKQVVTELHKMYLEEAAVNPEGFARIALNSPNPDLVEIYRLLPKIMRTNIENTFGEKAIYVRKELIPLIFGQRKFSLISLVKYTSKLKKSQNVLMQYFGEMFESVLRNQTRRKVGHAWQRIVATAKDTIVIKSINVLMDNIISNTILLMTAGVPIKDIFKNHLIAIKASKDYIATGTKIYKLKIALETKSSLINGSVNFSKTRKLAVEAKIARLEEQQATNPIRELQAAGIYQTIIEDLDLADTDFVYKSSIDNWIEPVLSKVPNGIRTLTKQVFMTHDTPAYKFLRQATQISDFVARFVLHQHNINNKHMSKEKSFELITDAFINYDLPTHPTIQYANDIGLFMFSKFLIRIQKVLVHSAKNNPARVIAMLILTTLFGRLSNIFDTNILTGNLGSRVHLNPIPLMFNALNVPLIKELS